MRPLPFLSASILGSMLAVLLAAGPAHAALRYVAAGGSSQTCTSFSPCGFISTALGIAAVGDTIVCLSTPAAEGLIITKSVTIDCSAARFQARDFSPQTNPVVIGITVNIPVSSNDPLRAVRLRGITLDGGGAPQASPPVPSGRYFDRGIEILAATSVHIEDSVISNVSQQGIRDARTGGQTRLYIKDSFISGNGGPGISLVAQGTAITVIDNVRSENNAYGVVSATGNNVFISRSVFSGNTIAGVEADSGAVLEVINSVMSHNTVNVQAFGTVRLQENAIKFSNTAIQGGAAVSMGSNRFSGNGATGATPLLATGAPPDVFN